MMIFTLALAEALSEVTNLVQYIEKHTFIILLTLLVYKKHGQKHLLFTFYTLYLLKQTQKSYDSMAF